jgi:aspartate/methionine/tyrosine aminotransferase
MSIKFENLKPSASMEVMKIAGDMKKEGKNVFPLSVGDTHFQPPKEIIEKISTLPKPFSHYSNAEGIDELRSLIATQYNDYQKENVIVVPGLKQGIYYALAAVQKKRLCILEPAWLGYEACAQMNGYEIITINTSLEDWEFTLRETSFDVIIICSPNNPDGKILSKETILNIINISTNNDAWIITDFIYDRYIYNGEIESHSLLLDYKKLIIGNGYSKSHAMTGFRIGYLASKQIDILKRIVILQQNLATCAPTISQYLLLNKQLFENEINRNVNYYFKNRELVTQIFPEWSIFKPQGGFYYFIDLNIYGIKNGDQFCKDLLKETGVALIPGSAYGKGFESFVRLSFSIDKTTLNNGLLTIKKYLNENN